MYNEENNTGVFSSLEGHKVPRSSAVKLRTGDMHTHTSRCWVHKIHGVLLHKPQPPGERCHSLLPKAKMPG